MRNACATYEDARICSRASLIACGTDERRQRFSDETPYLYQPLAGLEGEYRWRDAARVMLRDYNLLDLSI